MDELAVGKVVHFVMSNGVLRPAVVVNVWDKYSGCSNLQVFLDGTNDAATEATREDMDRGMMWATSVCYSEDPAPRTWHWPE